MAEQIDSSSETPESDTTPAQRGWARLVARSRPASTSEIVRSAPAARRRRAPGHPHPIRSALTVTAVAGLVATVAIPFITPAGSESAEAAVTLQQVAAENAQELVIASEANPAGLTRGGYSATTPDEIQKKKDEEAAKAAAAARIAAAATASSSGSSYTGSFAQTIASPGSVVRPLTSFNNFGEPYAGHKGTDYMADRGTPIYSIADGVVVESAESSNGWGVYVKIAHNIGGQSVTSLYAHMLYGSRQVSVGQSVSAGQFIGQVSDTGRAFGTHLHLEIYVNGSWVDPEGWLVANAG